MNVKLIGKHEKDSRACRDGLALTLDEMMAQDKSICYVDCDLMGCINTGKLQKAFPERTFNAGIAEQKQFQDITDADWQRMLDVNLMGAVRTIRACLPDMLHRKRGSIVTVSSVWGQAGASCESHYAASKAGLIGLTKSLALELGPSGIRVNCVAPGVINTDMNAMHSADTMRQLAEETPLGRIGTAAEVADSILYLCSERASFVTGQVLGVTGGF